MFITTCNLQRTSLVGRLCSRGRRWRRQSRSPAVPRADPAPSASPACTGGPPGHASGAWHRTDPPPQPSVHHPRDWEAISVPGRRGPRPSIGPSSQAPERAGRRDAGGRELPWRPREPPCSPMIARSRRRMVTPAAALTHGDGACGTRALRAGQQLPAGAPRPRRLTRLGAVTAPLAAGGRHGRAKPVPADHPRLTDPGATGKAWRGPGWRRGSGAAAQRQGWQ